MSLSFPHRLVHRPAPDTLPAMATALHATVDLRGDAGGDCFLTWSEAPGARDRALPQAELSHLRNLAEAVSRAEDRGRGPAIVEARAALASRLFALLDGPERALGRRLEQAEARGVSLSLSVRAVCDDVSALAQHPATWMRWELLADAAEIRRSSAGFAVAVQLGAQGHAALEECGLRALFMAFSPEGTSVLDYEAEEERVLRDLAPFLEPPAPRA